MPHDEMTTLDRTSCCIPTTVSYWAGGFRNVSLMRGRKLREGSAPKEGGSRAGIQGIQAF